MVLRWIGALLILAASGGFGFAMAAQYRKEEIALQQLILAAEYMRCELECRLTPLPQLCHLTSQRITGVMSVFFRNLEQEFRKQLAPDARTCVQVALAETPGIPRRTAQNLEQLGQSLGRFYIDGQLSGLVAIKQCCQRDLSGLEQQHDTQVRSYRTLGFCAGAAIIILFL